MQKNFGKQPSNIADLARGFGAVLHDLTASEIAHGIYEYMRAENDIPTPSDVLKIARPPKTLEQLIAEKREPQNGE